MIELQLVMYYLTRNKENTNQLTEQFTNLLHDVHDLTVVEALKYFMLYYWAVFAQIPGGWLQSYHVGILGF
jgi:hypothetical protein